MRIVFIGVASFTGATPIASESEIRAVLDFAACFCAAVGSGLWESDAIIPVLCKIACCGICWVMPLSFCVTLFNASIGLGASETPSRTGAADAGWALGAGF